MCFARGLQGSAGDTPREPEVVVRIPHATRTILEHLDQLDADFWTHTPRVGHPLEVALTRPQSENLRGEGVELEVLIEDLAVYEDQLRARDAAARAGDEVDWYGIYRTPDEFAERLVKIKAINPAVVQSSQIGRSNEGRPIEAYRVTGVGAGEDKPAVVLLGGTHAREWVAHMSSMYTLENLVGGYGHDADITRVLDSLEFIFIPLLNPDGVAWSHSDSPFWRKNRRGNGGTVWGVDNNRNYSVAWGQGVGSHRGSETYPGEFEFSEPENRAIRDFLIPMKDRIAAVVDVHAHGGVLFAPYSYEGRLPAHRAAIITQASESIAKAMSEAPGLDRTIRWSTPGRYGGTSKDWAFDELEALSWTFELGESFMPPLDRIKPWSRALLAGVIELGTFVDKPLILAVDAPGGAILSNHGLGESYPVTIEAIDGYGVVDPDAILIYQRMHRGSDLVVSPAVLVDHGTYRAHLVGTECDQWVTGFYAEAKTIDGFVARFPEDGTFIPVEVGFEAIGENPCQSTRYWSSAAAGDTATTGRWTQRDPEATTIQPEDDSTRDWGRECWFTDSTAPRDPRDGMVNGTATLTYNGWTADFRGRFHSAEIEFLYWAAIRDGGLPVAMVVETSTDGGASWSHLATFHADHQAAWKSFRSELSPGSFDGRILVRFRAGVGEDDVLGEFGVDDVRTVIQRCNFHPADFNRDGVVDLFDLLAFQTAFDAADPRADLDRDGEFTIFDFLEFLRLFEQ